MILRIVRGIPGSGKSTWAKKMFKSVMLENDMFCMKNDKYMFDAELHIDRIKDCENFTEQFLAKDMDVVVVNTFVKGEYMNPYFALAFKYKAQVEVYTVVGDFGSIHDVPDDIIQSMKDSWESIHQEEVIDLTDR